jgi:hypothetical protein
MIGMWRVAQVFFSLTAISSRFILQHDIQNDRIGFLFLGESQAFPGVAAVSIRSRASLVCSIWPTRACSTSSSSMNKTFFMGVPIVFVMRFRHDVEHGSTVWYSLSKSRRIWSI